MYKLANAKKVQNYMKQGFSEEDAVKKAYPGPDKGKGVTDPAKPDYGDIEGQKTAKAKKGWGSVAHNALNAAGQIPGVGAAADIANASLYAAEGNKPQAALSLAAAVPGAGLIAGAAQGATQGGANTQAAPTQSATSPGTPMQVAQSALSTAGKIPLLGVHARLANAGLSAAQGKPAEAWDNLTNTPGANALKLLGKKVREKGGQKKEGQWNNSILNRILPKPQQKVDEGGETTTPSGAGPNSGSTPQMQSPGMIEKIKNNLPTIGALAAVPFALPAVGAAAGLTAASKYFHNRQKEQGTTKTTDPGIGGELPKQ